MQPKRSQPSAFVGRTDRLLLKLERTQFRRELDFQHAPANPELLRAISRATKDNCDCAVAFAKDLRPQSPEHAAGGILDYRQATLPIAASGGTELREPLARWAECPNRRLPPVAVLQQKHRSIFSARVC